MCREQIIYDATDLELSPQIIIGHNIDQTEYCPMNSVDISTVTTRWEWLKSAVAV
jgi:hypothetical protein